MTNPYDIEGILERLTTGSFTETDIQILRNSIARNTNPDVVQIGNKYAVSIGHATGPINLGDNITYQGVDAETIREILRSLRDMQRQQPFVSNTEALRYLQQQSLVRNRPGVPFQWQVLVSWLILSLLGLIILLFTQTSNSLIIKNLADFIYYWVILFLAATIYGFLGIFLQGVFQYRWRFSEVRNYWIVWFLYPIIAPFFIALWMVFYGLRYGDRIFPRFFRFW
ncbi:hypothetical protein F7734_26900 [Scytonema sp. UIC 10036]|uniref:hypothetical protein n=1 Tax=Scytonema sp. UIC 10036 TaxID=2304196 RepID=UPI0012DAEE68|nr:hypothetical protein [Scytonema sp. UIC 10036]MUG95788.1 hypothetical protein [Scytonema sp. UIC 10036]